MSYAERAVKILNGFVRRPLSSLSAALAGGLIIVPLYQLSVGNVYLEPLNYVDGTTLVMVGVLLLRGLVSLRRDTDLQAAAMALIGALSFVFAYEAVFKLSFYTFPWRMPPPELREFVIQVGIALTALVGFAYGRFRMSTFSWMFAFLFAVGWILWLLVGFPQLSTGENFYTPVMDVHFTQDMIYTLNRATKILLCLVYYFLYSQTERPPTARFIARK